MEKKSASYTEYEKKAANGYLALLGILLLLVLSIAAVVFGGMRIAQDEEVLGTVLLVAGIFASVICIFLLCGLKVINPKEALVLVLFGKYCGSLKKEGFFWVNPFCTAVNPTASPVVTGNNGSVSISSLGSKKVSLKAMTLNNEKQTVNDELGNPVIIGNIVIWRVVDTAKAVFHVNNYKTFLSIQCDSAVRNVTRLYPYDIADAGDEKSLRGSSQEVADRLKEDLQSRVEIAGIEIMEVRITHLSYAPEIAAAMLQRQQAQAIIAARQKIVEGAVGMVEMALNHLSQNQVVQLDEERKAAMVSNLLVVLCGNRDAQPIVNSGSIY
jgi:regulator of protease activity HflC (stomatin/prohibitin superfamily)